MKQFVALCAIFCAAHLALAQELVLPAGTQQKVVETDVFEMRMLGLAVGKSTTTKVAITENGAAKTGTRAKMEMSMDRLGAALAIGVDYTEIYDASGNLERFRIVRNLSDIPQIVEGKILEGQLHTVTRNGEDGAGRESVAPWDPKTVGEKQMDTDYRALIAGDVGTSVTHLIFSSDDMKAIKATATYMGQESRDTSFGKKTLHRIQIALDNGLGAMSNAWVDGEGKTYEEEMSIGGISMQLVRLNGDSPAPPPTVQASAQTRGGQTAGIAAGAAKPDFFSSTFIKPSRPIPNSKGVKKAVYALKPRTGKLDSFYSDEGQKVLTVGPAGTRLEVAPLPIRPAAGTPTAAPASAESLAKYLKPSSNVQSDDPAIIAAAREAVGDATTAGDKASRLESWVFRHMSEKNFNVGFATAKEAFDSGEGDCSEHAVLLVAMCRAAGIPARGAQGIVYADSIEGFGFHMWAEAYIDGAWRDLDGTRPGASVDATHIQMGSSELADNTMTEMAMGMINNMGNLDIAVESLTR